MVDLRTDGNDNGTVLSIEEHDDIATEHEYSEFMDLDESDEASTVDDDDDLYEYLDAREDYRNNPYRNPELTDEQERCVNERMNLLAKKGVYPYDFFDSWEKFNLGR